MFSSIFNPLRDSKYFKFCLLVSFLIGCTPVKYVASPDQSNGTQKVYKQGLELLVSQKKYSDVTAGLKMYERDKQHMQLILFVQNKGNEPFNVIPTSINVLHEKEGESVKLDVYPPDEAVDKITFGERLAAALNTAAAAYNQNTNIDTDLNEDLAQSSALEAAIKGNNVRETLLRNETLFEGESVFGAVYFAIKDSGKLKIIIPAGNESHTFYFKSSEN